LDTFEPEVSEFQFYEANAGESKSQGYMTGNGVEIGVLERMPGYRRKDIPDFIRLPIDDLLENLKIASCIRSDGEISGRFIFSGF
jgi:hypothetical protein